MCFPYKCHPSDLYNNVTMCHDKCDVTMLLLIKLFLLISIKVSYAYTVKTQVFRSAIYGITTMFRRIYVLTYVSFSIAMALPFPCCETPLPQRPSVSNSFYNPLAVHVHPPVPASDVLHEKMRSVGT